MRTKAKQEYHALHVKHDVHNPCNNGTFSDPSNTAMQQKFRGERVGSWLCEPHTCMCSERQGNHRRGFGKRGWGEVVDTSRKLSNLETCKITHLNWMFMRPQAGGAIFWKPQEDR